MAYYKSMHSNRRPDSTIPGVSHRFPTPLAVGTFALAIALLVVGCGNRSTPKKSPPTPEEKAYLQNIQIVPGRVEAAQNFLGHTVTTVNAEVKNKGKKTVLYLVVNLTFMDIEGKPIQTKQAYPISGTTLALKPGETRPFKVSFDQVPAAWNQAPPKMTPARVVLAGE